MTHALLIPLMAGIISEVPTGGQLKEPFGTEFDTKGTPYVVEMISGNRLFRLENEGKLEKLADGFNGPHNLAVLPDGDILIGDTWAGNVKRYDAETKKVTTQPGYEAPKGKEKGMGPYCITLTPDSKTLLIANLLQIHAIDLETGKGRVVAGNGKKGKPEDGAAALDAPLVDPRAVGQDSKGNIYILERGGNALRVVDTSGKIRTVVNASGKKGNSGDGGPGLEATMNGPKHLCIDIDDTVLIADAENHVVRRFDPKSGMITRIAGTGKNGKAGLGGEPTKCELARPHGVTIHPLTKEIWITDSYNNRILKMTR
ncbi:MAG: NHL repeat-containing protein [Verrucomicrobiaceae bacterium]|nr:NHL repeat-containing protein [Verrucomicrobiaceae bacterium]